MRYIMPFVPFIIICVIGFTGILSSAIKADLQKSKAFKDRFDKLYSRAQYANKSESLRKVISDLESYYAEYHTQAFKPTRKYCDELLTQLKEKHQLIAREERCCAEESARITAKKQHARESELSEHHRMVTEQRRLMTASLRYDILARDGFRCKICGASAEDGAKLHVDHILPVSKGGKTEMSNLRTLCERCNLGKSDKIESVPAPPAVVSSISPVQLSMSEEMIAFDQNWSIDEAVQILNQFGVRFVDHTNCGGCFWIELTPVSEMLLKDKTIDGKKIYTATRSKAFSNASAMFIK